VARLGAAAAPGAGTYDVELHFDAALPADFGPTSGLVADVRITPAQRAHVQLLPIEVLLEGDGDKGFVWVLDAQEHPQRREVTVAFVDGDRVAIASGLDRGARVISGGSAFLTSTTRVRVEQK
jgi:multidrug efflux pump subunit AcrA (membrane-fusion protein)